MLPASYRALTAEENRRSRSSSGKYPHFVDLANFGASTTRQSAIPPAFAMTRAPSPLQIGLVIKYAAAPSASNWVPPSHSLNHSMRCDRLLPPSAHAQVRFFSHARWTQENHVAAS